MAPVSAEALIEECKVYQCEGIADVKVVVDIGAHHGHFADYIYSLYPEASIYCYEPDPDNFDVLVEKYPWACQEAVGDGFHTASFNASHDDCAFIADAKLNEPITNGIVVDVVPLWWACRNYVEVDILKVDCEGSEYDIFIDASLATMKKIRYITMEKHLWIGEEDTNNLFAKISQTHDIDRQLRGPHDDIWRCWRR